MRPNRVKSCNFSITNLTADTSGNLSTESKAINGVLQKVEFYGGNYTATGSILVTVSGTGESLISYVSGTTRGNVAAGGVVYPQVKSVDNVGVVISGTGYEAVTCRVINAPVIIVGSGLGNGKSGLGVSIVYI